MMVMRAQKIKICREKEKKMEEQQEEQREQRNYKYRQKWLVMLMILSVKVVDASPPSSLECSALQQKQILDSTPGCGPRQHLVETRQLLLSNSTMDLGPEEVVQVIPDLVRVERCGGGCQLPGHRCAPSQVNLQEVEVMVVLARWPQGEHQVVCTSLQVEEHSSCTCGCRVRPQHCSARQTYHPASCSCLCSNLEERATCLREGKAWHQEECRCTCPAQAWRSCSTGYVFDFTGSCSCVLISLVSSEALLTTAVLLAVALAGAVVGMVVYKNRLQVKIEASGGHRTVLMSQISRVDYEERELREGELELARFDRDRISLMSSRVRKKPQNGHQSVCRLRSAPLPLLPGNQWLPASRGDLK